MKLVGVGTMGKYLINGRKKISGTLKLSGSKNSSLPILAASILNSGTTIIHNCPDISDVRITIKILKHIGCKVSFEKNTVIIDSSSVNFYDVPQNLVKQMRSSIIFCGSLLSRMKKVAISYPGGCSLGKRPIDFHIAAFKKLGAQIFEDDGNIICYGENLKGCEINLDFPSVGATQNIILAAIFADGTTKIINAAREPEIVDLQNFLKKMGADINGAGTSEIIINGVKTLHAVEYTVIPDRIVAGTFLLSAVITNGEIEITNVIPEHLPLKNFLQFGCFIKTNANKIFLRAPDFIRPIENLQTVPYPGFPTDLQAQFVSVLSIANGKSIVHEKIFESRNKHIPELIKMGAKIKILSDGTTFIIDGVKNLHCTDLFSKDLRGGAALILAALAAEGKTIVHDENYIERGYEKIECALQDIGADIKFMQ